MLRDLAVRYTFHFSCMESNPDNQKFSNLNINLNTKDDNGRIGFHWACLTGGTKTVEMLMQKSSELNIDLNLQDNDGKTGFHLACQSGRSKIVEMMLDKEKLYKLNLSAEDNSGKTGVQLAPLKLSI